MTSTINSGVKIKERKFSNESPMQDSNPAILAFLIAYASAAIIEMALIFSVVHKPDFKRLDRFSCWAALDLSTNKISRIVITLVPLVSKCLSIIHSNQCLMRPNKLVFPFYLAYWSSQYFLPQWFWENLPQQHYNPTNTTNHQFFN
ncbi:hypothetical protein Ahy_B10g103621 isoform B [Arachis hypogaea]|uniref:Uncharacterized protein n=1 Tax=Arachis hypogaea TaxID=3818 RepID=A0A444X451_ARAHY|nr:hypothetical protein Ahy_B10g103621 isoform B [Arachis hypogaea]